MCGADASTNDSALHDERGLATLRSAVCAHCLRVVDSLYIIDDSRLSGCNYSKPRNTTNDGRYSPLGI